MYRTAKHESLLANPFIEYKSVEELPGIGSVYGSRLRASGFHHAHQLLEKYVELRQNEQLFTNWLSSVCSANSRYAAMCFLSLHEWYGIWRHGAQGQIPKSKETNAITYEKGPIAYQMLLDQKIFQLDFDTNNGRLRNLTQGQTRALVEVSSCPKTTPTLTEKLNGSQTKIPEPTRSCLKASTTNVIDDFKSFNGIFGHLCLAQKNDNFKENDEIIASELRNSERLTPRTPQPQQTQLSQQQQKLPQDVVTAIGNIMTLTQQQNQQQQPETVLRQQQHLRQQQLQLQQILQNGQRPTPQQQTQQLLLQQQQELEQNLKNMQQQQPLQRQQQLQQQQQQQQQKEQSSRVQQNPSSIMTPQTLSLTQQQQHQKMLPPQTPRQIQSPASQMAPPPLSPQRDHQQGSVLPVQQQLGLQIIQQQPERRLQQQQEQRQVMTMCSPQQEQQQQQQVQITSPQPFQQLQRIQMQQQQQQSTSPSQQQSPQHGSALQSSQLVTQTKQQQQQQQQMQIPIDPTDPVQVAQILNSSAPSPNYESIIKRQQQLKQQHKQQLLQYHQKQQQQQAPNAIVVAQQSQSQQQQQQIIIQQPGLQKAQLFPAENAYNIWQKSPSNVNFTAPKSESNISDSIQKTQKELNNLDKNTNWRVTPQDIAKYFEDERNSNEVLRSSLAKENLNSISQKIEFENITKRSYSLLSHIDLVNEHSSFDQIVKYSKNSQTPKTVDSNDDSRSKSHIHKSNNGTEHPCFHEHNLTKNQKAVLEASDDGCSKPFKNGVILPANEGTCDINKPTNVESDCDIINLELNLENNDMGDPDEAASFEKTAIYKNEKNSIRLFCDMLSKDLEQLPEDKIRKLKLKILELVYSEIDEHTNSQSI